MGVAYLVREELQGWAGGRGGAKRQLERQIAEAAAHVDAASHRLLSLVREYDRLGFWKDEGFPSCAHWFAARVGMGVGAAREYVRVANALAALPKIDEALRKGEVSYSQVRAITRGADAENEEALLACARSLSAARLERTVRSVVTAKAAQAGEPAPEHALMQAYLRRTPLPDGWFQIEGVLSADQAAVLFTRLDELLVELIEEGGRARRARQGAAAPGDGGEAASVAEPAADGWGAAAVPEGGAVEVEEEGTEGVAVQPAGPAERPHVSAEIARMSEAKRARGRAEALVYLAESRTPDGRRRKPIDVALFADRETLAGTGVAWFADGTALSAETARRLTCSASMIPVTAGPEGNLLDIGRRSRVPTEKLESAVILRDRCCRFPGCENLAFIDTHHIVHWAQGGPTNLDNLLLLCKRHHTLVHEGGFRCEVDGGQLRFSLPNGEPLTSEPLERPGQVDESFRAWLRENHPAGLARPVPDASGPVERVLAIEALYRASGLTPDASG